MRPIQNYYPIFFRFILFFLCCIVLFPAFGKHTFQKNALPGVGTDENVQVDRLISKAEAILFTQPDSAFFYANQALQLAKSKNYSLGMADGHQVIGTVFFHQSVYNEALSHLLQAEKLYKKVGNSAKIAENLNQQGLVNYIVRQPDLALKHHQEALQLYEQLQNIKGIAYSYGCLGHLYEKKRHYKKALDYQQKALTYYQQINDKRGIANILENIGSIYEDEAKYAQALEHFSRSIELSALTGDSLSMIISFNNIGDIYRKTGDYPKALEYTNKSLALAIRLNNRDQISSTYKDLSKIYSQVGDYQKAYTNLELGRTMYEDLYTAETTRQLNLMQTLFGIERKNSEIQLLENKQRLDNFIKLALGAGITLMALLGMLVISRQRLKIIKNKELIEQNKVAYDAQTKLIYSERENAQLREFKLQNELESKSKSLTAHTLHIIGKNKILEEIQQKLIETIEDESPNQRKKLKSLVKMIDFNFVHDRDWDDFRKIFEQVHQDFFSKLQYKYPDLTPADVRLAALIKLNLPSKDMATTLGISQDSLRIARYRLKKKLSMEPEDSLSSFIQRV